MKHFAIAIIAAFSALAAHDFTQSRSSFVISKSEYACAGVSIAGKCDMYVRIPEAPNTRKP